MDLNPVEERLQIEGIDACMKVKRMDFDSVGESLENDGIDRISNLPISVLLNVMYRLPAKDARATSVLSSRWHDYAYKDYLVRMAAYRYCELKRKRKLKIDCSIDRISELPDLILEKILSYLPTKDAVGTTILSTRWKHLSPFWYPPVELELDDTDLLHPRENDESEASMNSFRAFVDKLLFVTLRDVPRVESLHLECEKNYGDADIMSWIAAALGLHVQRLALIFSFPLDDSKSLFNGLDGCKTLVSLRLKMQCELLIPDNFSLPALKRLYLSGLVFDDDDGGSINEMIDGCPMLEELVLIQCEIRLLGRLSIQSPLLQDLFIQNTWFESIYPYDALEVHAPNLNTLMYTDNVAHGYMLSTFKSPTAVHIDVGPSEEQLDDDEYDADFFYTNVARIVAACCNTEWLFLSECSILAIGNSSLELPQFQNLTSLALGSMTSEGWMLLASLLHNAPKLEHLGFEQEFKPSEKGYADFEHLLPNPPTCLELHLKKIEFWDFSGREDEMKLTEYFLQNGVVLENVRLDCIPSVKSSISQRMLSFPKSEIVDFVYKAGG